MLFLTLALSFIALSGFPERNSIKAAYAAAAEEARVHRLGDAMESASNHLTESVRSFAATGDPADMWAYWREIDTDRRRELAIATLFTMHLPPEEEALLLQAKRFSDELAEGEMKAIRLIAESIGMAEAELPPALALRKLDPAETALDPRAKLEKAKNFLFGSECAIQKGKIIRSIEAFRDRAAERTAAATAEARDEAGQAFATQLLLLLIFLFGGAWALVLQYLLVSAPIKNYTEALAASVPGSIMRDFEPSGAVELVTLATAFNQRNRERDSIERALRDSELRLRSHLEFMPLAAIDVDEANKVVMWNPAAERTFGYRAEEALGRQLIDLVVPERLKAELTAFMGRLDYGEGPDTHKNANRTKDGQEILCEWHNAPLFDSTGRRIGWSSIVQDITERQREADEILYLSRHDPLTGLFNRRFFQERLNEEKQRWRRSGKTFSLIMADIDNFKNFNDDYGHECGDLVLRSLSEIMLSSLRETDSVGRWGGEEFIVLLPETGSEGARELAEKLRKMVEALRVSYEGNELGVTITAGYATYRGGDLDECIKMSDTALLKGKASGRNVIVGED